MSSKSYYNKVAWSDGKSHFIQDRERHRGVYCISQKWHKWAKRYMNRYYRRNKRFQNESE